MLSRGSGAGGPDLRSSPGASESDNAAGMSRGFGCTGLSGLVRSSLRWDRCKGSGTIQDAADGESLGM